jgi:hypothetical protein
MEAATWSAMGLLAAGMLGTLFYLGSRIDALGVRLDARIDALAREIRGQGARLDARIDALAGEIRGQGARLDAISDRLAVHIERHAG